MLTAYKTTFT